MHATTGQPQNGNKQQQRQQRVRHGGMRHGTRTASVLAIQLSVATTVGIHELVCTRVGAQVHNIIDTIQ